MAVHTELGVLLVQEAQEMVTGGTPLHTQGTVPDVIMALVRITGTLDTEVLEGKVRQRG